MKEAEFSRSLSGLLHKAGLDVVRIESGSTGCGIPDMFVQGHGTDFWLELKSDDRLSINDKVIKVQWRPGQIPWALTYYQRHRCKKCVLTVVKVSDGIILIPMLCVFEQHLVYNPIGIPKREHINFSRVLNAMVDCDYKAISYLDAINQFVDRHYPGVDYAPECLWEPNQLEVEYNSKVFNNHKLNIILTLEATVRNS